METHDTLLANAALSAVLNYRVVRRAAVPRYFLYHRLRHKRRLGEIARPAGLQLGPARYVLYSAA